MRNLTINEIETVSGGPTNPGGVNTGPGAFPGGMFGSGGSPGAPSLGDGIQEYIDVIVDVIEFIF